MASVVSSEFAESTGVTVSEATALLAAESRDGVRLSIVGMAIMGVVLLFIRVTFGPLVEPRWLLDAWMVYMLSVMGFLAVAMGLFMYRRPGDAEIVDHWIGLGARATTGLNIGIAASPWILLPEAEPALRSLMVILYVWYVSTLVMTRNAAVPISAWQIVMLTASTATFILWSQPPYALIQAVFVAMIGATMLGLRLMVRRTTIEAVEARIASERAEAATRVALTTAAKERDAKTRFIASASHDLQQPLQAAHLFFERAVASGGGEARDNAIDGTRRALASTQALIGQMLDHLRLEAGAVAARPVAVSLGALLADVAAEHRPAAQAAGMRIRFVPSRVEAVADPLLLRRALSNLVANAVRHARGERILLGVRRRGGSALIWVIDDGSGVAPADRDRLFEDYMQGSGSAPGGFGLGLASVSRAMALMNGAAGLEPGWTGGSAFYLVVPAVVAARETPELLCAAA